MRLLAATVAALAFAAPATAGQIVVHLGFAPGKLAISAPAAKVGASGSATVHVTVADGRGSGAGWQLLRASQEPLSVRSITASCAPGSTCTLPRAASAPAGATVLRAARGTGMGVIRLTIVLTGAPSAPVSFSVA